GFVLVRDVRAELRLAGLPEAQWQRVVSATKPSLLRRHGRYYHPERCTPRLLEEHAQQDAIAKIIRGLIRQHRASRADERRGQVRVDFIQPLQVRTDA